MGRTFAYERIFGNYLRTKNVIQGVICVIIYKQDRRIYKHLIFVCAIQKCKFNILFHNGVGFLKFILYL